MPQSVRRTKRDYLLFAQYTSWLVFALGVGYGIVTIAGFTTVRSAEEPIGQPYFMIMELLILMIAPLMGLSMIGSLVYADRRSKPYALTAVLLMFAMTAITCIVHSVVLVVSHSTNNRQLPLYGVLFSFRWPSVVYVLDILAWDVFFALAMFFFCIDSVPNRKIGKVNRTADAPERCFQLCRTYRCAFR